MCTAMEDLDLDPTPNQACVANVDYPVCHTGVLSFFLTFQFQSQSFSPVFYNGRMHHDSRECTLKQSLAISDDLLDTTQAI
jgi:hypothetical protein